MSTDLPEQSERTEEEASRQTRFDPGAAGIVANQDTGFKFARADISGRVPHLGHSLLFLALTLLLLLLSQLLVLSMGQAGEASRGVMRGEDPKRLLIAQGAVYIGTLAGCFLTFPLLWGRGFLAGLNWNGSMAKRHLAQLIPLGLTVGLAVQAISSLIPTPKSVPMDEFFRTTSDVWLVAVFGTLLAPLFEEIAFRGFLLPAFSIAFDWLGAMAAFVGSAAGARLAGVRPPQYVVVFTEDRSAGRDAEAGNLFFRSTPALAVASLMSSFLFAWLHSDQIGRSLGGVSILFCVSLVLTLVRVKARSVACSTVVHMSYNLSVFVTIFVATGGFRHLDRLAK